MDFIDYPDNTEQGGGYTEDVDKFPSYEDEVDYSFQAQPRSASPADALAPGKTFSSVRLWV